MAEESKRCAQVFIVQYKAGTSRRQCKRKAVKGSLGCFQHAAWRDAQGKWQKTGTRRLRNERTYAARLD